MSAISNKAVNEAIIVMIYEREIELLTALSNGRIEYFFSGFSLCGKKLNLLDAFENIRDERQFKALTGVSIEEFGTILPVFSACYNKSAQEEYENGERQRMPGGGCKGKLKTMKDKLFFILFYLKTYPTFDVLGHEFDLGRSQACRNVHKLSKVLQAALLELEVLPKREFGSVEEMMETFKNIKDLFIDATERPHFRHKDYDEQGENYSGKQKDHTKKKHSNFKSMQGNPFSWFFMRNINASGFIIFPNAQKS